MNIIHSFFLFFFRKRKSVNEEIYKPANKPEKHLMFVSKSSVQKKRLSNINPKTYTYDSELIWKHLNNSVQTKTATSTLKKK